MRCLWKCPVTKEKKYNIERWPITKLQIKGTTASKKLCPTWKQKTWRSAASADFSEARLSPRKWFRQFQNKAKHLQTDHRRLQNSQEDSEQLVVILAKKELNTNEQAPEENGRAESPAEDWRYLEELRTWTVSEDKVDGKGRSHQADLIEGR